jgi:hypothetical protein
MEAHWRAVFRATPSTGAEVATLGDLQALGAELFGPDDVTAAVKAMQDKAPGQDGIRVSVLKAMLQTDIDQACATHLAQLYNSAVQQALPSWSKHGVGHLLHKKGSRADPANYRLIVLQPVLMKLLEKMVDSRLRAMVAAGTVRISAEQGGFMPHRSTHDSVFLLQCVHDGAKRRRRPLYTAFLDLRRAFDSVSHVKLLEVLRQQGVGEVWLALIGSLLADRKTSIGDAWIDIEQGTPQGSPLSPLLFILFMEPLIRKLRERASGVELSLANKLCSLLFADDICLVASSLEDLQVMLDVCSAWATDMGMAFNASKSVLLVLKGPKQPPSRPMLLMGEPMTWQQEARYLGIIVTRLSRPTRKLPLVKPVMWASVFRLKRLLDPWLPIPLLTQVGLLMTDVMAGALYPAAVQDVDYDAIDVLINKQLRRLTITPAHASATWLRCELGVLPSRYMGHRRALQYL